eukprot:g4310.t1
MMRTSITTVIVFIAFLCDVLAIKSRWVQFPFERFEEDIQAYLREWKDEEHEHEGPETYEENIITREINRGDRKIKEKIKEHWEHVKKDFADRMEDIVSEKSKESVAGKTRPVKYLYSLTQHRPIFDQVLITAIAEEELKNIMGSPSSLIPTLTVKDFIFDPPEHIGFNTRISDVELWFLDVETKKKVVMTMEISQKMSWSKNSPQLEELKYRVLSYNVERNDDYQFSKQHESLYPSFKAYVTRKLNFNGETVLPPVDGDPKYIWDKPAECMRPTSQIHQGDCEYLGGPCGTGKIKGHCVRSSPTRGFDMDLQDSSELALFSQTVCALPKHTFSSLKLSQYILNHISIHLFAIFLPSQRVHKKMTYQRSQVA